MLWLQPRYTNSLSLCLSICSRSRRKMQNVANVSFLGMFVMYLLAALFGYLTFNGEQNTSSKRVTTPFIVQSQGELYSEAVFVLNGGVSVRAHRTGAISSQVLGKSPRQTLSRNRTSCLMFLRFPDSHESLCNAGVSQSHAFVGWFVWCAGQSYSGFVDNKMCFSPLREGQLKLNLKK